MLAASSEDGKKKRKDINELKKEVDLVRIALFCIFLFFYFFFTDHRISKFYLRKYIKIFYMIVFMFLSQKWNDENGLMECLLSD